MHILLVAYEIHIANKTGEKLEKANQRRNDILAFIRRHDHRRLSESSYAIEAHQPAEAYAKAVLELTEDDDELYIMPLVGPLMAYGRDDVHEWLEARLRRPG
ncbi:hypothetical protein [Polyangium fumosum]|uniref:Uncharacterized protein n=1 Tax=Polyangium fumosum TaxID=889272 RepID=A0A4U1JIA0_9BACT|nr:hypothetical protein [Polyangium fumosum]TKD12371.1 hypothetical protein E8A74_04535 [Polyangium fumosum]